MLELRVGMVMLPTDPWPETVARARHLEALGYDHLWTYDHLSWRRYRDRDWHAAMPWLTGVAAATERIRLGTMVASPNFRHPVPFAKECMTLDHLSGGRFVLGLGAGGLGFDATVLGDPELPPARRVARLAEFAELTDLLLRQPVTSYRGEFYAADEARMIPGCVQQPRVPIALAAAGPKTIALAARHADAWITYGEATDATGRDGSPDGTYRAVAEQLAMLDRACAAIGRDIATIDRILLAGNGAERPLRSVEEFERFTRRYAGLGITDVVLHHPRADDEHWDDPAEMVDAVGELLPLRFHVGG